MVIMRSVQACGHILLISEEESRVQIPSHGMQL